MGGGVGIAASCRISVVVSIGAGVIREDVWRRAGRWAGGIGAAPVVPTACGAGGGGEAAVPWVALAMVSRRRLIAATLHAVAHRAL